MYTYWPDINLAAYTVRVSHKLDRGWSSKATKKREIPIPTKLVRNLKAWKAKLDKACNLVFPTAGCNQKLDFLEGLKAVAERAKVDKENFWLHKFRATFATWSLWAGVNLRMVQQWLGHSDMESTMRYLKPSRSQHVRGKVNEISLDAWPICFSMGDPIFLALSRYLVNAAIHSCETKMKTTNNNTQGCNQSIQPSHTSGRSCIGLTLTMTLLCGLAVSGLSTYSIAQAPTDNSRAIMGHPGWVQIPGQLIRPDCVHEVPNGARVEFGRHGQITGDVTLDGALIAHYDACPEDAIVTRPRARTEGHRNPPGAGNGWVKADQWNVPLSSSDDIDYMAGTWTVPSYPSASGALIYLFNGIESANASWILQPVLQYGLSPAGGGNYWAIASWLVSSNQAFHSPLETVYPGNSISGFTEMTAISGGTHYWEVEVKDTTTGAYSHLSADVSGQHWTWAYAGVLDAYKVTSCSQFPTNGRAMFRGSVVEHGFPVSRPISPQGWYGAIYSYGGPSCHFKVVAASRPRVLP